MKKRISLVAVSLACWTMIAFADEVVVKCSKDVRKVDGPLITYTLLKNMEENLVFLKEARSGVNMATGKGFRRVNVIGEGLACTVEEDVTFECSRDMSRVDGPLSTFTLSKDSESNKYSLIQSSVWFDMTTGKSRSKTETLSEGLDCK